MRILILEDDFTSRTILQKILLEYGEVVVTVNGKEALIAYEASCKSGDRYDLICLDIMVPEMDGQAVLRKIRQVEKQHGFDQLNKRSQIIMITALNDLSNVMTAFNEQCEGYIIKPFDKNKIAKTLKDLELI